MQQTNGILQRNIRPYRGRLAPSPTGYLHLGHACTFLEAFKRAQEFQGTLILRIEDIDRDRCKAEFTQAILEDLKWLDIFWEEGPDIGGPFAPYGQSQRQDKYLQAWKFLKNKGLIYPCKHSRKDVQGLANAPHDDLQEEEKDLLFPLQLRPSEDFSILNNFYETPHGVNWRFCVPQGRSVTFEDRHYGMQHYVGYEHFGDFLIFRKDGTPAYELAVVVDDYTMQISEVVRGEDLLLSTARQLLLYEALEWSAPHFYHVPLVCDANGKRLAKRHDALSIRELRAQGPFLREVFRKHIPNFKNYSWFQSS